MSTAHSLIKGLDLDLIARLRAGTKFAHKPMRKINKPRKAETYRAAKRNALWGR